MPGFNPNFKYIYVTYAQYLLHFCNKKIKWIDLKKPEERLEAACFNQ